MNFDLYHGEKQKIQNFKDAEKHGNLIVDSTTSDIYVVTKEGTAVVINDDYINDCIDGASSLFTYEIMSNKEVKITGLTRPNDIYYELETPTNIQGYPVTTIGAGAFNNCSKLFIMKISEGVTNIENSKYLFSNCPELIGVTFPTTLTTLSSEVGYHVLIDTTTCTKVYEVGKSSLLPTYMLFNSGEVPQYNNQSKCTITHGGDGIFRWKPGLDITYMISCDFSVTSLYISNNNEYNGLNGIYITNYAFSNRPDIKKVQLEFADGCDIKCYTGCFYNCGIIDEFNTTYLDHLLSNTPFGTMHDILGYNTSIKKLTVDGGTLNAEIKTIAGDDPDIEQLILKHSVKVYSGALDNEHIDTFNIFDTNLCHDWQSKRYSNKYALSDVLSSQATAVKNLVFHIFDSNFINDIYEDYFSGCEFNQLSMILETTLNLQVAEHYIYRVLGSCNCSRVYWNETMCEFMCTDGALSVYEGEFWDIMYPSANSIEMEEYRYYNDPRTSADISLRLNQIVPDNTTIKINHIDYHGNMNYLDPGFTSGLPSETKLDLRSLSDVSEIVLIVNAKTLGDLTDFYRKLDTIYIDETSLRISRISLDASITGQETTTTLILSETNKYNLYSSHRDSDKWYNQLLYIDGKSRILCTSRI